MGAVNTVLATIKLRNNRVIKTEVSLKCLTCSLSGSNSSEDSSGADRGASSSKLTCTERDLEECWPQWNLKEGNFTLGILLLLETVRGENCRKAELVDAIDRLPNGIDWVSPCAHAFSKQNLWNKFKPKKLGRWKSKSEIKGLKCRTTWNNSMK